MRVLSSFRRILVEPALRRRALVVALYGLLSPLPLVGTLGYESSLVTTAPMSLLGIGAGVDAMRAARAAAADATTEDGASPLRTAGPAMLREVLILAGLALATLLLAQLWNPTCEPLEGLEFFALGPALSAALGGACGLGGAALARRSRRRQLLVGALPMLLCLLVGLRRIYADPVVFAFDPFWGYFAGPLYDEAVAITSRYLWFRAYNVTTALAAVLALDLWLETKLGTGLGTGPGTGLETGAGGMAGALRRVRARPWSLGALAALGLVSGSLGLRADRYHFNATVEGLAEALSGTLRTEHFVIHYDPAGATARELDLVAAEHEFAWHRLAQRVGHEPAVPVHSFVFRDPARKRVLMGAGNTEVSPPWRGHLYLNEQPFPHRVLHHELAHAFEGPLGDPVFGVAARLGPGGITINLALVEGFAEALAPRPRSGLDLHDQAAVLHRLELRPPLESLMGLSFWGKSSRHAYAAAGSFCLWLLETRGVERLVTLYGSGGDFEAAYGEALAQLEPQWVEFLEARPIGPRDIEAQRQRYKKRAIFERPCAHRSANLAQQARRAQERGDLAQGLHHLETLCAIEPERTEHRIALARVQARAEHYEQAQATLEQAATDPDITHTLASAIDERLGDLALRRGDPEAAREHYERALTRSVEEPVARALQLKQLGTHDPALAQLLLDYFAPFAPETPNEHEAALRTYVAIQIRERPRYASIGAYLVGTQLLAAQQGARAAEAFERALDPEADPLPTPQLLRAAREGLLVASVRARDYARAREVLGWLEADPDIGNGHRTTYALWSERLDFFEHYRPDER